jgi:hypothetical protein
MSTVRPRSYIVRLDISVDGNESVGSDDTTENDSQHDDYAEQLFITLPDRKHLEIKPKIGPMFHYHFIIQMNYYWNLNFLDHYATMLLFFFIWLKIYLS